MNLRRIGATDRVSGGIHEAAQGGRLSDMRFLMGVVVRKYTVTGVMIGFIKGACGQLQPFGFWSQATERVRSIDSGRAMDITVEEWTLESGPCPLRVWN